MQSAQSLVKYDNPALVGSGKGKGAKSKKAAAGAGTTAGGKALPPVDNKQLTVTEDILNSILPPRCVVLRVRARAGVVRLDLRGWRLHLHPSPVCLVLCSGRAPASARCRALS
jgi:hypothetical protein